MKEYVKQLAGWLLSTFWGVSVRKKNISLSPKTVSRNRPKF